MTMLHPCKCTSYNGRQCYNCLNGAHDLCDSGCKTKRNGGVGARIIVTTHTPTTNHPGSETSVKRPPIRFTPEEINNFLTFLLEGGADKSCSNVYLIITQLRDDLIKLEAFRDALCGNAGWAYDLAARAYKLTTEKFDEELYQKLPLNVKRKLDHE